MARARPTRCRSPPESVSGRRPNNGPIPQRSATSLSLALGLTTGQHGAGRTGRSLRRSGVETRGRPGKIRPIRLDRSGRLIRPEVSKRTESPSRTSPELGRSSPAMSRRTVDFPAPEGSEEDPALRSQFESSNRSSGRDGPSGRPGRPGPPTGRSMSGPPPWDGSPSDQDRDDRREGDQS